MTTAWSAKHPVITKIKNVIVEYKNGNQGQMKAAGDDIIGDLLDNGMAEYHDLVSANIGVHPSNRDGIGLEVGRVHELLDAIASQGWSNYEVTASRCFEVGTDEAFKEQWYFNDRLTTTSDGFLTEFKHPTELKYLSVTSSHTAAMARAVRSNCAIHTSGIGG